jgi:hypothetical protein
VDGTLTVESAMFVLDMDSPAASKERDEMQQALAIKAEMDAEEAWEHALPGGSGYREARTSGGDRAE